jgi:hypothetical protein
MLFVTPCLVNYARPGENEFMNLLNSMNRSWTFMKWFIKVHHSSSSLVHERFMNWNSLKFMNFWWTVYWFMNVFVKFLNCSCSQTVGSWTLVEIGSWYSWTFDVGSWISSSSFHEPTSDFMNSSWIYFFPKKFLIVH